MRTEELDRKRVEASVKVYQVLKEACFISVRYGEHGAAAFGVFIDGVCEFIYIPYRDDPEEGWHDVAMRYVEQMAKKGV